MQNPDFAVMRDHLTQLATSKPALVLGLSIQDTNIQQIFAHAQFAMPWTWPASPPAAVFWLIAFEGVLGVGVSVAG